MILGGSGGSGLVVFIVTFLIIIISSRFIVFIITVLIVLITIRIGTTIVRW